MLLGQMLLAQMFVDKMSLEQMFVEEMFVGQMSLDQMSNRTAHIRHQCRKTTVLCSHRCLINTGVEKMNNI